MSVRPYRDISRRKCRQIRVGSVPVGGDAPITVQSMTNTLTADAAATIAQVQALEAAGADIVRVSCPDEESTAALPAIVKAAKVPLVADIHFHYKRALEAAKAGAACLRINPGNIGSAERVREVVKAAKDHGCSMRIGVNAGSLEKELLEKYGEPCPEAMVESALTHAKILEDNDFREFKISVKASHVPTMIRAYRMLATKVPYPLHLGVTEAGTPFAGSIKSAVGMGALLMDGIGDTIRVSLTADPVKEVEVAWEILKALGLRERGPVMIACPSCGRDNVGVENLARVVEERLRAYSEAFEVAVMGCAVNGPGEAGDADFGIAGGRDVGFVYAHGRVLKKVSSDILIDELFFEIDRWIEGGMQRPRRLKMAKPAALAMAEASLIPLD
jgi:(E)-4-hydroxy-3-methylbut-2-enyl-diphosphate synthase